MRSRDGLRLVRPANALTAAAAAYVGSLLAGGAWPPTLAVGAAMLASFAFAAAGNVRNDMGDVAIDRVAHPTRPLARGAISLREARDLSIALYLVALAAGVLVSWWGALLVALALPVMEGYERWGKARGLPGNLMVALLTAAPFVLGSLAATGAATPVALVVAGLAALATAGREVLKDIEDMGADARARRTLPMRVGARAAASVAAGFLVGAVLLSPLPALLETVLGRSYLVAIGAADVCFLVAAATGLRAPGRAQRLAKVGMLAALVALLLGRALG